MKSTGLKVGDRVNVYNNVYAKWVSSYGMQNGVVAGINGVIIHVRCDDDTKDIPYYGRLHGGHYVMNNNRESGYTIEKI